MFDRKTILYSGGADSTYLLYIAAQDISYCKLDIKPMLRTISFNAPQLPGSHQQKVRRAKFIQYIKETYKCEIDAIEIDATELLSRFGRVQMPQQICWLSVLPMFNPYIYNETLEFGYVKGDDFWHWREFFCRIIDNAFDILYNTEKVKITVSYPLEWVTKTKITRTLIEHKLDKFIWICDTITDGNKDDPPPCGKCDSCIEWMTTEKEIEIRNVIFEETIKDIPKEVICLDNPISKEDPISDKDQSNLDDEIKKIDEKYSDKLKDLAESLKKEVDSEILLTRRKFEKNPEMKSVEISSIWNF